MKLCQGFHIKTPFTFWDKRTWDMWKVCLPTFRNNRICKKFAYFLRNLQTSRANNSRIVRIKNAKFSGYCFYMNTNIHRDFQICISVPLMQDSEFHKRRLQWSWSSTYLFSLDGVKRYSKFSFYHLIPIVAQIKYATCSIYRQ